MPKKDDKSNKQTNLNPFNKKDDNKDNNNQNQQQQNQQQNQQQQNQNQQQNQRQPVDVNKWLRDAGLYEGVDMDAYFKAVSDGDAETATKMMERMMQNSALTALAGAEKIFNSRLQKLEENTRDTTTKSVRSDLAVQEMHKQLPFTKEEAVAPIAKQVLEGFMGQGDDAATAIEKTQQYFDQTLRSAGEHLGYEIETKNDRAGSRGFGDLRGRQNDNNSGADSDDDDDDWVKTLTGGNVSFEEATGTAQQQQQQNNGETNDE